jgi:cytochrome c biogenesis protein CcmG/thiol:disulfide interchange protein DsbE
MIRTGALWAGVAVLGFAACVIGEPAPSGTAKESAKVSAAAGDYPSVPAKKLWAKTDVRGTQAPKVQAEEWLSSEPETKDKTVLVDLWATWCMPCRALIPELEEWQEKFKGDLVVIGLTSESAKDVEAFHAQRGSKIKYPIARDSQSRLSKELGVSGIPHILVISSDGVVRWQGYPKIGEDRLTESVLKQIIDADRAARARREDAKDAKPGEAAAGGAPAPVTEANCDEKQKPEQKKS